MLACLKPKLGKHLACICGLTSGRINRLTQRQKTVRGKRPCPKFGLGTHTSVNTLEGDQLSLAGFTQGVVEEEM